VAAQLGGVVIWRRGAAVLLLVLAWFGLLLALI
jgi:hypothetical protein